MTSAVGVGDKGVHGWCLGSAVASLSQFGG